MAKTIYLLRHGEPEAGFTKRFLGRLDPDLSPTGMEQARNAAEALAPLAPERCLASPLRRAWHTAAIIGEITGIVPEAEPGLLEINFGELEGKTFAEASASHPEITDSWQALARDFAFPGGETFAQFNHRAKTVAESVKNAPESSIILVAHGGILRGVLCHLLGLPADGPLRFRLAYAALTTVEVDGDDAILTGFNVSCDLPVFVRKI